MTIEELKKIPFHTVSHISYADEHVTTYSSEDGRLGFCVHVKMEDDVVGRSYRHYRIGPIIYKSKRKFLEALAEYNG